jgi:hypothetical protein
MFPDSREFIPSAIVISPFTDTTRSSPILAHLFLPIAYLNLKL